MPSKPEHSLQRQQQHADHQPSGKSLALRLLAHDLRSPENVGSLFRLADALAIEHLYLSGTTPAPPNSRLRRVARSTDRQVSHEIIDRPHATLQQLRQQAYRIVSLELTTHSIALQHFTVSPGDRLCLIAGGEKHGVSDDLLALSDTVVHIPMLGHNSSMNVAMACAIACYQLSVQLRPRLTATDA